MNAIHYTAGGLDFNIIPSPAENMAVGHATLQMGLGGFDMGGFVVHATGMLSADQLRDLAAAFITAANQCEAEVIKALDNPINRVPA